MSSESVRYGLLAEFGSGDRLIRAAREAVAAGYTQVEAYAPLHLEGLSETLHGSPRIRIALLMLLGAITLGVATYAVQYYAAVFDYPINVGGRPLDSWPAFIPPAVEMTLLGAALAGVIGTLLLDGLPRFHHPLFDVPRFAHASSDGFFLCIRAGDPRFEPKATRRFLSGIDALEVSEVAGE
ncbi:MAG TPA: DUF3341 domain-containing protein [Casimicrobiaceae bacterium]|nr:DUF3341 domain-containing protein [Casimicrobiaceae bacterium]